MPRPDSLPGLRNSLGAVLLPDRPSGGTGRGSRGRTQCGGRRGPCGNDGGGPAAGRSGPGRSRPDDSEAQRAVIAAFPTDPAAFAAVLRLTGDAPLDWLLGLAQADNRALRQAARQRLRAVDPVRHIRAADSIYAAVNAWPCRDFLELARSPDPIVSVGALLLARNMAWPEKGRAALDSLRPDDGPDIRLLKLAAVVGWNGEAAVPDAAWEFVRAFPDDPRDLARLLTLENSLYRSEDSPTLSLLRGLARDGTPELKMAADAKWRGARTLRRASLPPSAPVSGRKLARSLLPLSRIRIPASAPRPCSMPRAWKPRPPAGLAAQTRRPGGPAVAQGARGPLPGPLEPPGPGPPAGISAANVHQLGNLLASDPV